MRAISLPLQRLPIRRYHPPGKIEYHPWIDGASKTVSGTETEATGFTPPKPVNGMADFQKYIENNIVRPDGATSGQRVVVVLGFQVDKTGKIDSIKVIRSPGKSFSDEAIRLLREGPAWRPAERDGKPTADDVRVRIVFK